MQLQPARQSTPSLRYSRYSKSSVYATEMLASARFCDIEPNVRKITRLALFKEMQLHAAKLWACQRFGSVDCGVDCSETGRRLRLYRPYRSAASCQPTRPILKLKSGIQNITNVCYRRSSSVMTKKRLASQCVLLVGAVMKIKRWIGPKKRVRKLVQKSLALTVASPVTVRL